MATVRALAAYLTKFPFAHDLITHPAQTAGAFANATLLVLQASHLRYLDNAAGIGTRWSLRLVDGQAVGPPELEARE